MNIRQREFLEETTNAMEMCMQIKFLLTVLRDFCEFNEDASDKFLGLTILSEFLLSKNNHLYDQIEKVETFAGKLDFN